MKAALKGSYVDFVIFMGESERYPSWFQKELDKCTYTDESKYTFWVHSEERRPDYYEKKLIEDYSVIIRNSKGLLHITDYDVFQNLYITFRYDGFTNSGLAAFEEDTIEYVECKPGVIDCKYPDWFYDYYTESVTLPLDFQGYLLYSDGSSDDIEVVEHCVILRNRSGDIMDMLYSDFKKYYDDSPSHDRDIFLKYNKDNADDSVLYCPECGSSNVLNNEKITGCNDCGWFEF